MAVKHGAGLERWHWSMHPKRPLFRRLHDARHHSGCVHVDREHVFVLFARKEGAAGLGRSASNGPARAAAGLGSRVFGKGK